MLRSQDLWRTPVLVIARGSFESAHRPNQRFLILQNVLSKMELGRKTHRQPSSVIQYTTLFTLGQRLGPIVSLSLGTVDN